MDLCSLSIAQGNRWIHWLRANLSIGQEYPSSAWAIDRLPSLANWSIAQAQLGQSMDYSAPYACTHAQHEQSMYYSDWAIAGYILDFMLYEQFIYLIHSTKMWHITYVLHSTKMWYITYVLHSTKIWHITYVLHSTKMWYIRVWSQRSGDLFLIVGWPYDHFIARNIESYYSHNWKPPGSFWRSYDGF